MGEGEEVSGAGTYPIHRSSNSPKPFDPLIQITVSPSQKQQNEAPFSYHQIPLTDPEKANPMPPKNAPELPPIKSPGRMMPSYRQEELVIAKAR